MLLSNSHLLAREALPFENEIEQIRKLPPEKIKEEVTALIMKAHRPISYREAQFFLFTVIDVEDGHICGVYSPDECLAIDGIPDHKIMNVEHSWPQSEGATGVAKSDLHHLFIASNATNTMRSSLPFCDVSKLEWNNNWSKLGYSAYKEYCFEPPALHKGDVARAFFYFSLRYKMPIDKNQERFFRKWHEQDPVTREEEEREKKIAKIQRNRNVFILYPELVNLIQDF